MTTGEKIRRRREQLGMKQREVVAAIHELNLGISIDTGTLSKIESRDMKPTDDQVVGICLALQVTDATAAFGIRIADYPSLARMRDDRVRELVQQMGWSLKPHPDLLVSGAA